MLSTVKVTISRILFGHAVKNKLRSIPPNLCVFNFKNGDF